MVEGCAEGADLVLEGRLNDGPAVEGGLALCVSGVEDMYRFISVRRAERRDGYCGVARGSLGNAPDDTIDRDVFFTHGFNVSEFDARAWGAEIFKRLWQSGSKARFNMVTWAGDYHYVSDWFNGLHYQHDVYNALRSGAAFRSVQEILQPDPTKRVLIAQSLGNMMACEALRQGLRVDAYFMFDAAVASECIDASLQNTNASANAKYVPEEWAAYDPLSWSACWHRWFRDDRSDSRGRMGWSGRFIGALENASQVVNYYSTGDEVFFETDVVPGVLDGVPDSVASYCWQKQETHKGRDIVAGTTSGGWGFFSWDDISAGPVHYSAVEANRMVADAVIPDHPVFATYGTEMRNRNATDKDIDMALAKYVPALSSPMGGNPVFEEESSRFDLNSSLFRSSWGRVAENDGSIPWKHSDMKDMAYLFVYRLFKDLVLKGKLKGALR